MFLICAFFLLKLVKKLTGLKTSELKIKFKAFNFYVELLANILLQKTELPPQ
jgi:hypothetical protein